VILLHFVKHSRTIIFVVSWFDISLPCRVIYGINVYSTVDHLLGMENCRESTYGCCPDGLTAADGPNFVGCASNDPIPSGLCIESEFGCCINGVTPAAGPFHEGCHVPTCQVKRPVCIWRENVLMTAITGLFVDGKLHCESNSFNR